MADPAVVGAAGTRFGSRRAANLTRVFGSTAYFRLWCAQVVSSLGDWIGLIAVTAIAARVGGGNAGAAVGLVLSARVVPGLFLGSFMGVMADRWNRKWTMVGCDGVRGLVLLSLPFVRDIPGLVLASLVLELCTLLWASAKEATVPNLVERSLLPKANSLSLAASYGTFPISSAVFAGLVRLAQPFHSLSPESLALWFDVVTFWASASIIASLAIPRRQGVSGEGQGLDVGRVVRDLKEGFRFIGSNGVVRGVMIGLACGLAGGGTIVPLGPVFSTVVLHAGPSGFGVLLTAFGVGVATGVLGVSIMQNRLPHLLVFQVSVFAGGVTLMLSASMWRLPLAALATAGFGVCAGSVYVLGFSLLGAEVSDDLRGRIFAALYTSTRLCLFLALVVAPFVSALVDDVSRALFDRRIHLWSLTVYLPGVRVALWLGGAVILAAGLLTRRAVRSAPVVAES